MLRLKFGKKIRFPVLWRETRWERFIGKNGKNRINIEGRVETAETLLAYILEYFFFSAKIPTKFSDKIIMEVYVLWVVLPTKSQFNHENRDNLRLMCSFAEPFDFSRISKFPSNQSLSKFLYSDDYIFLWKIAHIQNKKELKT